MVNARKVLEHRMETILFLAQGLGAWSSIAHRIGNVGLAGRHTPRFQFLGTRHVRGNA